MTTAFRALVRKDLLLFFGDRRAVLLTFVAPIVFASFFGYIFGNDNGGEASRIPILLIDRDGSAVSRDVAARLAEDKALKVVASAPGGAREAVRRGRITAAIEIPANFGADAGRAFFSSSKKPELRVLYDPSHRAELSMVQGILTGHVMQAVSKEMFSGAMGRSQIKENLAAIEQDNQIPPADRKALLDLLRSVEAWTARTETRNEAAAGVPQGGLTVPFEARAEAVTATRNVRYNGYAHSFAGMGVQFILFLGIDVGIGLLYLRQRGLWKRLRAAPVSRSLLLGSRATSAAATAMMILLALFAFARLVFGVRIQGSMAGFLCVCAGFSLMTSAFGLLIAALGKTPEATRGLAIFATLTMVMLGGAWVPTFVFPQWLQRLTVAVPTRWAVDGLDAVTWRGLGFADVLGPIAGLFACSLLFCALAVARFRWEAEA